MIKEILLKYYIYYFENLYKSNNKDKIKKSWNSIKKNTTLLNYATDVNENKFNSKIISYMILTDKEMYNTEIYLKLIKKIYSDKLLSRTNLSYSKTFLLLSLDNQNIILDENQKKFLIEEAEISTNNEENYKENEKITFRHGSGIFNIRYKILINKNFSLEEKKNLFINLYPDDEVKVSILEELKWFILNEIELITKKNYKNIYNIEIKNINIDEFKNNKYLINLIKLYKEIRNIIPENTIKIYIHND